MPIVICKTLEFKQGLNENRYNYLTIGVLSIALCITCTTFGTQALMMPSAFRINDRCMKISTEQWLNYTNKGQPMYLVKKPAPVTVSSTDGGKLSTWRKTCCNTTLSI
jgi:hypothetical protein